MNHDAEDILNESLNLLGEQPIVEDDVVKYGPLALQVAAKQGKANTLLADHIFSPALYLAERIERGLLLTSRHSTVLELGAGSGLPSLLAAISPDHPSLVVVTDYPDEHILGNLRRNVENNQSKFQPACKVRCVGYEWGGDVRPLLDLLHSTSNSDGYDTIILSDLLHFHGSHTVLISSIESLLSQTAGARIHVAAGKYTRREICDEFLMKASKAGFVFTEVCADSEEAGWKGFMDVSGLDKESLTIRKANCYYWIGRWLDKS